MRIRLFLCGFVLLATSGCSAVTSRYPVGERPAKITAEQWQGKWISRDGEVNIRVDDADKGLLSVTWTERNDNRTNTVKVELLESNGWLFANTRDWNDDPKPEYAWGRVRNEGGQITIWAPDLKAFKRLVNSGVLPGKLRSSDVVLDELKPVHLQQIISGRRGLLFEWDDPAALVRVREGKPSP